MLDYRFLLGSSEDDDGEELVAPGLDPPEAELPEPVVPEPDDVPPEAEPDALPLMPAPEPLLGAELELLELPGVELAPGAELELLLELLGALVAPGAELEPVLDDEVPGRVASLDLDGDDWSRLQPVTASAIVTAAATSVR